jgi:hypothetical protein
MKLLREPLGQFVALGIVLFVVYALASDLLASDEARRIAITESEIELLATTWERQWQRAPTAKELHALVDSRVREEVLYREALALGLDRNDVVVRRRMGGARAGTRPERRGGSPSHGAEDGTAVPGPGVARRPDGSGATGLFR